MRKMFLRLPNMASSTTKTVEPEVIIRLPRGSDPLQVGANAANPGAWQATNEGRNTEGRNTAGNRPVHG